MLLVDYDYYKKDYEGSSIPGSSFKKQAIKASSKINHYTYNRINENVIDDNIRNTACEIAELLYFQDTLKEKILSDDRVKANETVGPHAISYINNKTFQEKQILSDKELEEKCYQICYEHLVETGLMYTGVI